MMRPLALTRGSTRVASRSRPAIAERRKMGSSRRVDASCARRGCSSYSCSPVFGSRPRSTPPLTNTICLFMLSGSDAASECQKSLRARAM
eukprot:4716300-Prymnesium_polylepis.2